MRISDWSSDVCSSDLIGDILTTLNGREIFTGVGRGFSFQDLPAEALAGVDVYKSSSAERLAGGVAGGVNLRLRRALDFKRSEEHTSELQSLMRISYAVFCLKKKNNIKTTLNTKHSIQH